MKPLNPTPTSLEEALEMARLLERNAATLLRELAQGDLPMAHGYALNAGDQANAIAAGIRDLQHASEPATSHRYRDPLHGWRGDPEDNLQRVSAEDVREYCRYWEWARRNHKDPYGRWWMSKYVSMGVRELLRRRLDSRSWEADIPEVPSPTTAEDY